jgi:hypothetical protein
MRKSANRIIKMSAKKAKTVMMRIGFIWSDDFGFFLKKEMLKVIGHLTGENVFYHLQKTTLVVFYGLIYPMFIRKILVNIKNCKITFRRHDLAVD